MERSPKQSDDSHSVRSVKLWQCFGSSYPKNEIVFFGQIILLYAVVIAAIVNLSYPPLGRKQECPVDFTPLLLHWVHPTPSHVQDA